MADKPPNSRAEREEMRRLLARTTVIRAACELDLLVFLHRHPRALLTNEQLAAFVGYEMKEVARAVDAFVEAGLLERNKNPKHAARLYLLLLDGPHGGGLKTLLQQASTRDGRQKILELLSDGQSQASPPAIQERQGIHAVA